MTSRAWRLAQCPPWLVRFPRPDGRRAAGAGVLIGPRHVVTCAHVLGKQFDPQDPDPGRGPAAPSEVVEVEFPFVNDPEPADKRKRARVVGWVPITADESGDVALLELESELDLAEELDPDREPDSQVAYTPAPLACPPSLSSHQFSVHGFPDGDPATRHVTGVLRGASGPNGPWVQLDPHGEAGWAVEPGFSGAPIFDETAEAVVGIVALKDKHRTGHMLPMSYLRRLWPEVRSNCRWRLDLEASYRTHWSPRARGSEPASHTKEWFFTGRTEARRVIRDWLEGKDPVLAEHSMLLVTGAPGSGKSALLAHSLIASDPLLSRTVPISGPRPPTGAFDAAVYLKGRTCDEMTAQLARALNVTASDSDELVAEVSEYSRGTRFTVLADAVEEAASTDEAIEIAALLRELTSTGRIRVLAAVRTTPAGASREEILTAFGLSTPRIDLDDAQYLHRPDVTEYVARRLASEQANSARYRAYGSDELRAIGEKVARKANYSFLIAQLATGWLTDPRGQHSGPDDPGWEAELPETVGQAMDKYLRACRPHTATVKLVLTALAYARGNGLPRGATWRRMADALASDGDETPRDLEKVFTTAAQHLVERVDESSRPPTYRLFHDALDQHLRETLERKHHEPEACITTALKGAVPRGRDGERNWAEADAYTRDHLADHAAAAGQLDGLASDTEYLVHAASGGLLPYLRHVRTAAAQLAAAVYRTSVGIHATVTPDLRRQTLALDAARAGAGSLHGQLIRRIPEGHWAPRWATGSDFSPELRVSLIGHAASVTAVACTIVDGTPVAVTGDEDGIVRVWDLKAGLPHGQPLAGHSRPVTAVACTMVDGTPVAVTGDEDGIVRVWDLETNTAIGQPLTEGGAPGMAHTVVSCTVVDGTPLAVTGNMSDRTVRVWNLKTRALACPPLTGHAYGVQGVACTVVNDTPVAVTGDSSDGTVRVWDLKTGLPRGQPLRGHTYEVSAVACTIVDGVPVAVTSGFDGKVLVRSLVSRFLVGRPLFGHVGRVTGAACTVVDGVPAAVTSGSDGTVRVWDLKAGAPIGRPLRHSAVGDLFFSKHAVSAVACTVVDDALIAVTGGDDRTVRVWDLEAGPSLGQPRLGHGSEVRAVACTVMDGKPVAVTGSLDGTLRIWDLASGTPIGRPLSSHSTSDRAAAPFPAADDCAVWTVECTVVDGTPIAVSGFGDGKTRVWDLKAGTSWELQALTSQPGVRGPLQDYHHRTYHFDAVWTVACTVLNGVPVAVIGSDNGSLQMWDLRARAPIGKPLTESGVSAVACTVVDGTPVAVTGSRFSTLRVWDLQETVPVGKLLSEDPVSAVACTVVDGTPVAVTGGYDGTVRVWDLRARSPVGKPLIGHAGEVRTVACTVVNGTPVAVTGGGDHMMRVWDLRTGEPTALLLVPSPRAVALTIAGDLVVGMGSDVAVFSRRSTSVLR
ncbi:trypsin-like peptidase domain-containing protein [Streptomyces olivaceus]